LIRNWRRRHTDNPLADAALSPALPQPLLLPPAASALAVQTGSPKMALYSLTGRRTLHFTLNQYSFTRFDDCCQSQNAWLTRLLMAEDAWQELSGITSAIAIETDIPRRMDLRQRRLV
jgi:hypothetical protein